MNATVTSPLDDARAAGAGAAAGATLLPGAAHFQVIEEPQYAASGSGEHLYVEIEKEGFTTDVIADALAKINGKRTVDIGYAGRKDRHAVTRQWFSIHFGDEAKLAKLSEALPTGGRVQVLTVTRHANKIRLGHLAGNRFRLGLGNIADPVGLQTALTALAHHGICNRFGIQRFGIGGANLRVARALAVQDYESAVALLVDPHGMWRWGQELPPGFRTGPEGRVLGALRKGANAASAVRAAGEQLHKLLVSAAQSEVFNAVLDGRKAAGLLHRFRVGDIGCTSFGAAFPVTAEELTSTNERAAPGVHDAFTTGPLPGMNRLAPSDKVLAEEQAWAAATEMKWSWFAKGGKLEAPGERRPLLMPFRLPPTVTVAGAVESGVTWVEFSLASGGYATEVLNQVGVAIPADRR
jgi:tRNA pseudouridine13 synthase